MNPNIEITEPLLLENGFLIPEKSNDKKGKKTLVLDLDETLVHSQFIPFPVKSDVIIKIEIENEIHDIHVLIRPFVKEFLLKMSELYEIIIFTASVSKYADPLLDIIDIDNNCSYRLFREHCTLVNMAFIKDLSKLGRDLSDVVILDNSPLAYALHPQNGLPILTWFDDKNDDQLVQIMPILEFLALIPDVREFIPKFVFDNQISYPHAMAEIRNYKLKYEEEYTIDNENEKKNEKDDKAQQININIINNNITNYICDNAKKEKDSKTNKLVIKKPEINRNKKTITTNGIFNPKSIIANIDKNTIDRSSKITKDLLKIKQNEIALNTINLSSGNSRKSKSNNIIQNLSNYNKNMKLNIDTNNVTRVIKQQINNNNYNTNDSNKENNINKFTHHSKSNTINNFNNKLTINSLNSKLLTHFNKDISPPKIKIENEHLIIKRPGTNTTKHKVHKSLGSFNFSENGLLNNNYISSFDKKYYYNSFAPKNKKNLKQVSIIPNKFNGNNMLRSLNTNFHNNNLVSNSINSNSIKNICSMNSINTNRTKSQIKFLNIFNQNDNKIKDSNQLTINNNKLPIRTKNGIQQIQSLRRSSMKKFNDIEINTNTLNKNESAKNELNINKGNLNTSKNDLKNKLKTNNHKKTLSFDINLINNVRPKTSKIKQSNFESNNTRSYSTKLNNIENKKNNIKDINEVYNTNNIKLLKGDNNELFPKKTKTTRVNSIQLGYKYSLNTGACIPHNNTNRLSKYVKINTLTNTKK